MQLGRSKFWEELASSSSSWDHPSPSGFGRCRPVAVVAKWVRAPRRTHNGTEEYPSGMKMRTAPLGALNCLNLFVLPIDERERERGGW